MTEIQLIRGTESPEKLVCTAARNDYRSNGVINNSFKEIMEDVDISDKHSNNVNKINFLEAKKYTLIDHLIDQDHWGPFEHPSATIAMEGVTRVSMAQITRHRHFTFDIMSLRYVGVEDEGEDRFQIPNEVQTGEMVSRDGVSDVENPETAVSMYTDAYDDAMYHYQDLLNEGVPQEEARKVLPMGTKVNIVMSGNARAWMHLLNIRGKGNVQGEARRLAEGIMEELKEWMPYTFEKYDEEVLPRRLNP